MQPCFFCRPNLMTKANCCPLCAGEIEFYSADKRRSYCACKSCQLVFVPDQFHLDPEREKTIYDMHQNHIHDEGYRQFLNRIYQPMVARLSPAAEGLDFGCGPGPALAEMFREKGFHVSLYDLYYFPDDSVLSNHYDFIVATEVVEHLAYPGVVLDQLWDLLKPGGALGIMTKRVKGKKEFSSWHYKNDPTHICFFHESSFHFLKKKWNASLEIISDDVVIFSK